MPPKKVASSSSASSGRNLGGSKDKGKATGKSKEKPVAKEAQKKRKRSESASSDEYQEESSDSESSDEGEEEDEEEEKDVRSSKKGSKGRAAIVDDEEEEEEDEDDEPLSATKRRKVGPQGKAKKAASPAAAGSAKKEGKSGSPRKPTKAASKKEGSSPEQVRGGGGGAEGKLKRNKKSGYGLLNLIGAKVGERLKGSKTGEGVLVEITEGKILPIGECVQAEIDTYEATSKLSSAGEAACRYGYRDYPTPERLIAKLRQIIASGEYSMGSESAPLSDPRNAGGSTKDAPACKFRLLQVGLLHQHAKEAGHLEELQQLMERNDVTSQDILPLVGSKTLCLQCGWYLNVHNQIPLKVTDLDTKYLIHLDKGQLVEVSSLKSLEDLSIYKIQDVPVGFSDSRDPRTFDEILKAHVKEGELAQATKFANLLRPLSPTYLKSFLQKIVRLRTKETEWGEGQRISSKAAAVVIFLLLAFHRGSFNPEIQKFIRGITDAFKRLAVMVTEDSWVEGAPLVAFFAISLLSAEMSTFWPSQKLVDVALKTVKEAVQSDQAATLHQDPPKSIPKGNPFSKSPKDPVMDFETCYFLLGRIGAMEADTNMYGNLVNRGLKVLPKPEVPRIVDRLPIYFGLDFHCCRGIGYLVQPLELETFQGGKGKGKSSSATEKGFTEVFSWLFKTFTGRNPRRHQPFTEAEERDLKKVLAVQELIFGKILLGDDDEQGEAKEKEDLQEEAEAEAEVDHKESAQGLTATLETRIPVGILSSSLGPIPFKPKQSRFQHLILLGLDDPSERLVMRAPPRDNKDVDLLDVTDEVKLQALQFIREQKFTCKGVLLKKALKATGPISASFDEKEGWFLHYDGKKVAWDELTQGINVTCPVFTPPVPPKELGNFGILKEAFSNQRQGIAEGNLAEMTRKIISDFILKHDGRVAAQRLLSLLTDASLTGLKRVKFPKPGRDGKQGTDLAAFSFDPEAYLLALELSLIWPAALRPQVAPDFKIPNPIVFTIMWREVMQACRSVGGESSGRSTPTKKEKEKEKEEKKKGEEMEVDAPMSEDKRKWKAAFAGTTREMKPHQRDAVEELIEAKSKFGHFVCMDTGTGKTQIASAFITHLFRDAGFHFKYVIWIAPREVLTPDPKGVKPLIQELGRCGITQVFHCDPTKNQDATPLPYHFNVIIDDHLKNIPALLAKVASESIIIADEVDRMYALNTQRTSTALMLAGMSVKVLAMTATMIRNNKEDGVAHWMKFAHPCVPITKDNWLISMSSVVMKVFDSKIVIENEDRFIPVDEKKVRDEDGRTCLDLLRVNNLGRAAQAIYDEMTEQVVKVVQALKGEGVLLVANDSKHQARLIEELTRHGIPTGGMEKGPDPKVPVVVVRKDQCRGYNWGIRLGVLLEMPYFGNAADRRQMLGRLKRIGQVRPKISRIMLVPEGTFLARVYANHLLADLKNACLEALGKSYTLDEKN